MAAGGRRTARSRRSRGVCAERRGAAPAVCAGERDDCGGRRPARGSGPASGGRGGGSMVCRDARRPPARALPSRGRALGPGRGVGDRGCDLGRSLGSGCARSGCPDPSRDLRRPSSRGCPPTSSSGRPPRMRWPRCERGSARERIDSLATALLSQQVAGGDIAALMRRLAAASADRDRMADEARAATTQARFTGLLVVALPAGAALFAELLQPGFIARVLGEPASAAMLIAAAGLQLVGFAVIRRLGRPASDARCVARRRRADLLPRRGDRPPRSAAATGGGTRRARSRCTRARATRRAMLGSRRRSPVSSSLPDWRARGSRIGSPSAPCSRRSSGARWRGFSGRSSSRPRHPAASPGSSPSHSRRRDSSVPTHGSSGGPGAGSARCGRASPTRSICSLWEPRPGAAHSRGWRSSVPVMDR